MWETMKNSDVCAFFEGDLLTVIDKEGSVCFADWADRDRQSVPEPERTCPEALPKTAMHEALPVGDEVWVLTANPHWRAPHGQMQLVRLDRDLKELDRQDLYPLDEHLDYVYTGLYRNHTPHHLLTPTHYVRIGFVPRARVGTCPEWNWGAEGIFPGGSSWRPIIWIYPNFRPGFLFLQTRSQQPFYN